MQPSNPNSVTVFTTENCPACERTKQVLAQQGVAYTVREATDSDREGFAAQGFRSFPVVQFEDTSFSGFQMPKLRDLARQFFAHAKTAVA